MRIPKALFFLLVFLIPFEIYKLPVGGIIHLRPYQIAALVLLLMVGYHYLAGKISTGDLMRPLKSPISKILFIYFLISLISLVNAPDLKNGLQDTLILLSFLIIYWLVAYFVHTASDAAAALFTIVLSGFFASLVGLAQIIAYKAGMKLIEVMPGRPNSILPEPDWFGFFMVLALASLIAVKYLKQKDTKLAAFKVFRSNYFQSIIHVLFYMMIILTVARASWLAAIAIIGFFIFLIFIYKNNSIYSAFSEGLKILVVFLVSLGIIYSFSLTDFSLKNRFLSIITREEVHAVATDPESGEEISISREKAEEYKKKGIEVKKKKVKDVNVLRRTESFTDSLDIAFKHPVLGIGFGGITTVFGEGINANNIFIEILVATGVIGLMVFMPIFYYIFREGIYCFIKRRGSENIGFLFFILLGLIAMTIPNVFNSGLFLGFFWLYLGLASSILDHKLYE